MSISITFRHVEPTEAMKAYTNDKLGRLQKFLRQPMTAKVTLSVEKHDQFAEVRVSSGSWHGEAKEGGDDIYRAIDRVVDKLERQVSHSKGVEDTRKRRSGETMRDKLPADETD